MSHVKERIEEILNKNKIVLFMKGDRKFPQCGFSARAVAALDAVEAEYQTVNILEDEEIRQGIKEYANYPTIPQVYINKEFIGDSDILAEMYESGELKKAVDSIKG